MYPKAYPKNTQHKGKGYYIYICFNHYEIGAGSENQDSNLISMTF